QYLRAAVCLSCSARNKLGSSSETAAASNPAVSTVVARVNPPASPSKVVEGEQLSAVRRENWVGLLCFVRRGRRRRTHQVPHSEPQFSPCGQPSPVRGKRSVT